MLRIAHIVPSKYLPILRDKKFHMALAHVALEDDVYRMFYTSCSHSKENYVILDNGAFEGADVSFYGLCKLVTRMQVDEVILPDVLGDKEATLDACLNACYNVVKSILWCDNPNKPHLMGVAQGANIDEWVECAIDLLRPGLISVLGVPKLLLEYEGVDARIKAITQLKKELPENKWPQIHLLGCGDHAGEPARVYFKHPDIVRSVDSSIAFVYSASGQSIMDGTRPNISISFKDPYPCDPELLARNMNQWERLCWGDSIA